MHGKVCVVLAVFLALATASRAEVTSLSKLAASGQSLQCDFSKEDADGKQTGTFYMGNHQVRGELQISSPEGTLPMHFLRDEQWQYMWGGPFGENQGMKISAASASSASQRGRAGRPQGPDVDEEMEYSCRPWSVDYSQFVVPDDVQFQDMGFMVPGAAAGMPTPVAAGGDIAAMAQTHNMAGLMQAAQALQGRANQFQQSQCAACNEIPEGPDRDGCLQSMGCA